MKDLINSSSKHCLSADSLASLLGVSNATIRTWDRQQIIKGFNHEGRTLYTYESLKQFPEIEQMLSSEWTRELETRPLRPYTSIELFAGGGGLALGMELAGFEHLLLCEINKDACATLRHNRPNWQILQEDITNVDFTPWRDNVDLLTGGFPCQAFSYAGKQGGFGDTRGTLFFELARALDEIRPKVLLAENVKGLLSHNEGKTLSTIQAHIKELGYTLVGPRVLKALMYQVPQKRERLIFVAIRNDLVERMTYNWPSPYNRIMTLRDAFYKGDLYDNDVPLSEGQVYPESKRVVMDLVPEGGFWRDLPIEVQKAYMGKSFYLGGGKTGMARRLAMDEPSLTLTCAPAQKQTERCHPIETRPLSVREYARIQTFPDNWVFKGSTSVQYKQIGNAVPVNLAWAIGRALVRMLNQLY